MRNLDRLRRSRDARAASRTYYFLAFLLAAMGLAVGAYLVSESHRSYVGDLRGEIEQKIRVVAAELEHTFYEIETAANLVAAEIAEPGDADAATIGTAAERLIAHNDQVISLVAAPDLVVRHAFPPARADNLIGFDYRDAPGQLAAIRRIARTGTSLLVGPTDLPGGKRGYALLVPLDSDGARPGGMSGVVAVSLPGDDLFGTADTELDGLRLALRPAEDSDAPQFHQGLGDIAVFAETPVSQRVRMPGGPWILAAAPEGGWPASAPNARVIVEVVAFSTALLIATILMIRRVSVQRELARQLLVHAVDSMHDGFILYDADDRLVMWNSRAREFYAPSARKFRPGTPFETIIREEVRTNHFAIADGEEEAWTQERLEAHRNAAGVAEQYLADGRCIKIAEDKTPEGFIVSVIVDITELKNAQLQAERADRGKTEFLNNVSHELRTPLTVVMGYAALLSRPEKLEQTRRVGEYLECGEDDPASFRGAVREALAVVQKQGAKIEGSAKHLLNMVNEILDWAKVERRELQIAPQWIDAAAAAGETVEELRQEIERKGLVVTCECDGGAVYADAVRLKQILYNLLGNALKFTDEGSIRLAVETEASGTTFRIEDTGCGISEDNLDLIFERFRQIDGSDARSHSGTGLGLALTRHLVELHGGTVSVASEIGRGSSFSFFLPKPVANSAAA